MFAIDILLSIKTYNDIGICYNNVSEIPLFLFQIFKYIFIKILLLNSYCLLFSFAN